MTITNPTAGNAVTRGVTDVAIDIATDRVSAPIDAQKNLTTPSPLGALDCQKLGLPPDTATEHGEQVALVLAQLGHEPVMDRAARMLFITSPQDTSDAAQIARQAAQVLQLATQLRPLLVAPQQAGKNVRDARAQVEQLRRLMLAMAVDLRIVLIALASRLATLRSCVSANQAPDPGLVQEVLQVFAPLANRLGVWQLKWELEDLAFRYAQAAQYQRIADALEVKRDARQALIETVCERLQTALQAQQLTAQVYGRPKHIYSIAQKMAQKNLPFDGLYDLRAVRLVVDSVRDCYAALGVVHDLYQPIAKEFDDYIARPKANGYKSLHTVIVADDGKPVEVQIRTTQMHAFAEYGVAAHWRYKENRPSLSAGKSTKTLSQIPLQDSVKPPADKDVTQESNIAWLRQLLAWKKDLSDLGADSTAVDGDAQASDRISDQRWATGADPNERMFCLSPAGRVVELVSGGTPIDFAYALHSDLGHRCRGAKVDGVLVPLNTPLRSGQTVEILPDRKSNAGPSRDWLNPSLGYAVSGRSRSKVRAWFNALALESAITEGRQLVERELARLGKTANSTVLGFAALAQRMGFDDAQALFVAANKSDFHPRSIEIALESASDAPSKDADTLARTRIAAAAAKALHAGHKPKGDVLVVGVDLLMTQLARCCRPAPPDTVAGYITRGRGVSLHRSHCASLRHLLSKNPERLIECAWGADHADTSKQGIASHYAVSVRVVAADRQGLLRDISDAFSKHKINITAMQTQSVRGEARMLLSAHVDSIAHLNAALGSVRELKGVVQAVRR